MTDGTSPGWRNFRIADLQAPVPYALNGGPFGSKLVSSMYVEKGVPVIRGINLPNHSRFSFDGLAYVTEERANELHANIARPGDVVFTQRGTLGQVGLIPTNAPFTRFVVSQSQMKLTVDTNKADATFIYYLFRSPDTVGRLRSLASSSGVPHINLETLREFEVSLPPPDTQRRIAAILSTYDDLVENNVRRIDILQEIARRLYEEWFVHFRFPGHEGAGFVETKIGRVPGHWSVSPLQEALVLQRGFDLPTSKREPGRHPVFAATGEHGMHKEAKVKGPGVVTGRSGTLGAVTYVERDFWPLNTTLWVKEFRRVSPRYAFFLLSLLDLRSQNAGAAVPTLNRNDVHRISVAIPPSDVLSSFDRLVEPMFGLKSTVRQMNDSLLAARNLLLPKLISGEIDVSAAPRASEVVAA